MKLYAGRLAYPYRLIYSYVASREAVSRRDIESALGVNRTRTLPKIVRRLVKAGLLAEPARGRLEARRPPDDLAKVFVWKTKRSGDWRDDLAYTPVRLRGPEDTLSQFALCLYAMIRSLPHGRQSHAGLAKLLVVSRKRVATALDQLSAAGLVTVADRPGGILVTAHTEPPRPAQDGPAGPPATPAVAGQRTPVVEPHAPVAPTGKCGPWTTWKHYDLLRAVMAKAPKDGWVQHCFPQHVMNLLVAAFWACEGDIDFLSLKMFQGRIARATAIHKEKGTSPSCAYLLLSMLRTEVRDRLGSRAPAEASLPGHSPDALKQPADTAASANAR